MKKTFIIFLLSISATAYGAEFDTQQSIDGKSYVYCEVGIDCADRTIKVMDIDTDAAKNPEVPSKATPIVNAAPERKNEITVHFELRSSALSKHAIKELADALYNNQFKEISVSGHTDKIGAVAFNQRLARQRANSVVSALKKLKVDPRLISVRSKCCIENPPALNPDARKVIIKFVQ